MIPSILNIPELRQIQSMEKPLGNITSPNTSTQSIVLLCGPIFWLRVLGEADPRHYRGNINVADCRARRPSL